MIMSVYVLKAKFQGDQAATGSFYLSYYIGYPTRAAYRWPIYFMYTETGYLTKSTWKNILALFEQQWNLLHPGLDCILWLDYADIHDQPQLVLDLASRGILTLFFMKQSTKFSQPADQWLFACLKHFIAKFSSEAKVNAALHGGNFEGTLWTACFEAERRAFTAANIQASFSVTGTCPWDPELYMNRLDEALGKAEYTNPVVTMAVKGAVDVYNAHQPPPPRTKQKMQVKKDIPYDHFDLQRLVDDKERAAKEAAKAKKRRAKEKEVQKRAREETRQQVGLERAKKKRAREENRAKLRKERADRASAARRVREMNTCKGKHDNPRVWKSSPFWGECQEYAKCGYTLCPDCWSPSKDDSTSEMFKHEKECWGRVK